MLKQGELKIPAINVNDSVTKVPASFTISSRLLLGFFNNKYKSSNLLEFKTKVVVFLHE